MTDPDPTFDIHLLNHFIHQVINPLNGITGTLDNIIDGTTDASKRDQRLRAVRGQLVVSVERIRNLAYLSQLSVDGVRERLLSQLEDCLLPEIIIRAHQFFQDQAISHGTKIHLIDRTIQYSVLGHADLLLQVFINIFENAVKYGTGRVTVTPRVQKSTGQLLVEIQGSSIPLESSECAKIFELGFRGRAAKEKTSSGTGLGLYICRRILEVHGASIEAEHATTTHVTTMRIRFPKFSIAENHGANT